MSTGPQGLLECVYPEQTFHYDCSLPALKKLMKDPRLHNGRGYSEDDACGSEETEVAKEKKRQEYQRKKEAERENRGRKITWSKGLNEDGFLDDNLDYRTKCIAISGYTVLGLLEDGSPCWSNPLPTSLLDKLDGRQKSLSPPSYVAMGSRDRYFIQFKDGSCSWSGYLPIKETAGRPEIVCFGEYEDSYLIKTKDHRFYWRNIPRAVEDILDSRNSKLSNLQFISLGPEGEWFIRWASGYVEWDGPRWLRDYPKAREVYFGDGGLAIVRYN